MAVGVVYKQNGDIISPQENYQAYICSGQGGSVVPTNKRTVDKWNAARSWFPGFVRNRSFLDIGCATGFFVLKAVSYDASKATGCDIEEKTIASLNKAAGDLASFYVANFPIQAPTPSQAVLVMSLVHHLSRKFSFYDIAEGLARVCTRELVIEFQDKHDAQVAKTELVDKDWYCWPQLHRELQFYFEPAVPLGHGHHKSRTLYRLQRK